MKSTTIGFSMLCILNSVALAKLQLPSFFSDRMVLQQETGAKIWGTTNAGSEVTVSFSGQSHTAKANENGKWVVVLNGLKATTKGSTLTIKSGPETKDINDVVVGEVWLASGQSNMEWPMKKTASKREAKNAKDDLLRIYTSENKTAATPLKNFPGSWKTTHPKNSPGFTAVGYHFAKALREKLNVPVGIIECSWGGKPIESFISQEAIEALPEANPIIKLKKDALTSYEKTLAEQNQNKQSNPNQVPMNPTLDPHMHSTIYNGMIAPIVGYGARGVIWYQGESNARGGTDLIYGELLECLIKDWQKKWDENLSFYYVQLANFGGAEKFKGWVNVQDEMRRLLDDEDMQSCKIGMATINDIGSTKNIHPPNKKDVGERLARWALNQDYGMKDIIVSGPLYADHNIKGNTIELTFKYGKGLKSRNGKALKSFELAGANGQWKPAEAQIIDDKVIVSSKDISTPTKARYAWKSDPKEANLVNSEGLPTSCFTTK